MAKEDKFQTRLSGAPYVVTVNHGAVAGTARPAGAEVVNWIGSVEPTNAIAGDTWDQTT